MRLNKWVLGMAVCATQGMAQAAVPVSDVLFFPYVVSGGAVTTLVSVINHDTVGAAYYNHNGSSEDVYGGTHRYLHWRYHIKSANTNVATCFENNGYFPTSPLDMVTYDVSGSRGEAGVMFNDASVRNNWKAEGALNQLNAISLAGQRATLLVHNAGGNWVGPGLAGEALVVEFDTGSAWGYGAIVGQFVSSDQEAAFDFSWVGALNTGMSLLPQNEFTTRLFVTPLGQLAGARGVDAPNFGGFTTMVDLEAVTGSIRLVNRDESGISGGVTPQTVTCVGVVDVRDLVTAANVWNYVSSEGGWAHVTTKAPSLTGAAAAGRTATANAAVIKLDFRQAGAAGALNMGAGVGAMNSAYPLNF